MDYEPFQTVRMVGPKDALGPVSPLVASPDLAVVEWDAGPREDPLFADARPVRLWDDVGFVALG